MKISRFLCSASFCIAATAAVILVSAGTAFAAESPAVSVFTASPTSINNDYNVLLTWITTNATGDDLYFSCPLGVTLALSSGGPFPCNTRQSFSANPSDSGGFVVTNVSGLTETVSVTAYPKDSAGTDNDAGAMSTSFSVNTSPQPITDFSVSTTSAASGESVVLTWTGVDTHGATMEFDCAQNIQVIATSPAVATSLPCSMPAFSSGLPQSGSVTITAANTSSAPVTLTAHVLPMIAAGTYDSTHSRSVTVTVAPVPPHVDPSVQSFTSSSTNITSGVPFTLSWLTQNASGANIEFPCSGGAISIASVSGSTTSPLPCNTPAFTPALAVSGSRVIEITAQGQLGGNTSITLLPENADGTYLGTAGRSLNLTVLPSGSLASGVASKTVAPITTNATSSTPSATMHTSTGKHYVFTKTLSRGSKGADVSALQAYLALDPTVYPTGLVTGYLGPATQQALEIFQLKYGIAGVSDTGYGLVGPKTRSKLNALQ